MESGKVMGTERLVGPWPVRPRQTGWRNMSVKGLCEGYCLVRELCTQGPAPRNSRLHFPMSHTPVAHLSTSALRAILSSLPHPFCPLVPQCPRTHTNLRKEVGPSSPPSPAFTTPHTYREAAQNLPHLPWGLNPYWLQHRLSMLKLAGWQASKQGCSCLILVTELSPPAIKPRLRSSLPQAFPQALFICMAQLVIHL